MTTYRIVRIEPEEWAERFSNNVHKVVFGEYRPGYMDRIDYALLAIDPKSNTPVGYLTARELDSTSVYWQYGGGIPPHYKPANALSIYNQLMLWHSGRYKRVSTYTKNDNSNYLRMALKCGFRIIGVRNFKGEVLVELLKSFEEEGK